MIIFCPRCNMQHMDEPKGEWTNPPHKSHLCTYCYCIFRLADVETNGVPDIKSSGTKDNWFNTPEGNHG